MTRRTFILASLGSLFLGAAKKRFQIMTINGFVTPQQLGKTLIHEHFLVDFIGADKISFNRWDRAEVVKKVLPYLLEVKKQGVKSIFDCTPDFLGRDIILLQQLAARSGLQIITNTGYYGAVKNKYLPDWAFTETAQQLANRWIDEFKNGIQQSNVRPGFIKIGIDSDGPLSEMHQKLLQAAALTHLKTGLTICSHTGKGQAAFESLKILQRMGVHPSAFVWVHAQAEQDKSLYNKAANLGAWVSLDGLGWGDFDNYALAIAQLKKDNLLNRVLISHDAGWYKPDEPTGNFQGYTNIFTELVPRLRKQGFTEKDTNQLLIKNPAEAMGIRVRKIG